MGTTAFTPRTNSTDQASPSNEVSSAQVVKTTSLDNSVSPQLPQASHPPASGHPHLNPRSCVTCRRRKVRCNKREPCSNCVKAGIECIFPGPGRAPRKPRRPPDAELLSRLRRLEGVVETLGGTAAIDRLASATTNTSPQQAVANNDQGPAVNSVDDPDLDDFDPKKSQDKREVHEELGRLVIDEGRSRYVSNRFWASLGDSVSRIGIVRRGTAFS